MCAKQPLSSFWRNLPWFALSLAALVVWPRGVWDIFPVLCGQLSGVLPFSVGPTMAVLLCGTAKHALGYWLPCQPRRAAFPALGFRPYNSTGRLLQRPIAKGDAAISATRRVTTKTDATTFAS